LAGLDGFDLVVTTYGLLQNDIAALKKIKWHTAVLDEAQAIKNAATKRAAAARQLRAGFRLATTGTPIENHLGELHSLFDFLMPGLLGDRRQFAERFSVASETGPAAVETRDRLRRLISPFVLRRLKSDVLTDLPSRTEITLHVELPDDEAAFYNALRKSAAEKLTEKSDDVTEAQHRVQILAELTKLRRACCHPSLIDGAPPLPGAKLELFAQTIAELREAGHKALVFSQFVGHLKILKARLERDGVSYQYLDGSTPAATRARRVKAFQSGEGDIFLISLKAGGTGLNLTAADYVIHTDPWWNPAVEDQASDRAHRIGQTRPVTIYRLITKGTVEERVLDLHARKRDLAAALLAGTDTASAVSAKDLLALLDESR
jgi:SNF2 family DNA or RNA helicase